MRGQFARLRRRTELDAQGRQITSFDGPNSFIKFLNGAYPV
jgi:hypothetical protein